MIIVIISGTVTGNNCMILTKNNYFGLCEDTNKFLLELLLD